MTYPNKLTERAKTLIGPILTAIHSMKLGETKTFQGINKVHTDSARNHLYAYFKLYNIQGRYRITRLSETIIMILCRAEVPMTEITLGTSDLTAVQEFYQTYLININTEEKALDIVRTQNSLGHLADEAVTLVMDEWRRQNEI